MIRHVSTFLSSLNAAPETVTFEQQCQAFQEAVPALILAAPQQALAVAEDYLRFTACLPTEAVSPELRRAQAHSLLLLGQVHLELHDLQAAQRRLAQAAEGFEEVQDVLSSVQARNLAGKTCLELGALEDAERHLAASIAQMQHRSDDASRQLHAAALNHLAGVHHARGQADEALATSQTALALWETLGDAQAQARVLSNIGNIQTWQGQYDEAVLTLRRAYQLHQTELENPRSEAFILSSLGRLHHLNDEKLLAIEVMQAAQQAAQRCSDELLNASIALNLGTFCLAADRLSEASAHLQRALEISQKCGYRCEESSTLDSLGSLLVKQGRLSEAREMHQRALDIALDIGDEQGQLDACLHLGQVLHGLSDFTAARRALETGLKLSIQQQAPSELAQCHLALADVLESQGELGQAFHHLRALRTIERDLFSRERERHSRKLMVQFEVERVRHQTDVYRLRTEVEQEARQTAEDLVQQRTAELARAQHEVVTRLAMAAEYRDDTTGEHTRRVGWAAAKLARALGWPEQRAQILGVAARLHDVGKIGIPDTILLKAGKLTPEEYAQMQTHTRIGARILSGGHSELLQLAEEIALSHHERWDGQGYPWGLAGDAIPLTGRIVAVVDVFDALTQARPYKRAWTTQEALQELQAQAGAHFDPDLVQLAVQVLGDQSSPPEGELKLPGQEEAPMPVEDASHMLAVFEQLLVERSRELDAARRQAEQVAVQMERMALTDSLTQLANRRAFEADLEQRCLAHQQGTAPGVLVMSLDLDGLKVVNDTQGHATGDLLLTSFAASIAQAFAPLGEVYRLGGDEFALIGQADTGDQHLLAVLAQALSEMGRAGFAQASASCGVARLPQDAQTRSDLLRASDRRMYQDKSNRRSGNRATEDVY